MLASQVGAMAALASQYHISDIVISEMQRLNGDQEVRLFPFPCHDRLATVTVGERALMIGLVLVRICLLVTRHLLDRLSIR